MPKNHISISQVFWSVPDLKFAENILSLGLKIKKTKSSGPHFNTYQLSNGIQIITFVEHNELPRTYVHGILEGKFLLS